MGLDLTFLPMKFVDPEHAFSDTVLKCLRRSNLFAALRDVPSFPVPSEFSTYLCYDDEHGSRYDNTQLDERGRALRWVFVEDLLRFSDHRGVTDNPDNRAVWAYLAQLPTNDRVTLYWA